MNNKNHLIALLSEELSVGPASSIIDPGKLARTFSGGVEEDDVWRRVLGGGSQVPTKTRAYPHEFFHAAPYRAFIPEDSAYFFRGLNHALRCLYDNPVLVKDVTNDSMHELHLPFRVFEEKVERRYVLHVFSKEGRPRVRSVAYEDESPVLEAPERPHLIILRKKVLP